MDDTLTISLHFIASFFIFLGANLLIWYNSFRLLGAFFYTNRVSERFSILFLLSIVQIILQETIAGSLKLLTFLFVLGEILLTTIVVLVITRSSPNFSAFSSILDEIVLYCKCIWELFLYDRFTRTMSYVVVFVSAVLSALSLQTPPVFIDNIFYHFPIAVLVKQSGSLIDYIQHLKYDNFFYPLNGNLLAIWTLLPFRDEFFMRIYEIPFVLLIMLTFYGILRKLDVSAPRAYLFSFLPLVMPWTMMRGILNFGVDEVFIFSILAVFYYFLHFIEMKTISRTILLGIAFGIFLGTKYLAISFLPGIFFLFLYSLYEISRYQDQDHRRVTVLQFVGLFLVCGILLGGFAYLRNWIITGSPIYPSPIPFLTPEIESSIWKSAKIPQFYHTVIFWIQKRSLPLFSVSISMIALAAGFWLIWRSHRYSSKSRTIKAVAMGAILMYAGFAVYPFWIQHSRYVIGIFLMTVGTSLGVLEISGRLKNKSVGWIWVILCCSLLLLGFLLPNYSFYHYFHRWMLAWALFSGAVVTAIILLCRNHMNRFLSIEARSKVGIKVIMAGAVVAALLILTPLYVHYPELRTRHIREYHPPIYTWIAENGESEPKNILCLNFEALNLYLLGSRLQNRLFLLDAYTDEGWDEDSFMNLLRKNHIDWIVYNVWPLKTERDIHSVSIRYRKCGELVRGEDFYPPAVNWMLARPNQFRRLVKFDSDRRFPEAGLFEFYP